MGNLKKRKRFLLEYNQKNENKETTLLFTAINPINAVCNKMYLLQ